MHRSTDEPTGGTIPAGSRTHPYAASPDPGPAPDPAHVAPAALGALLRRHGWHRRGGTPGRYSRWVPPGPATAGTSLLVPDTAAFPDSEDLLAEALTALTRSAAPSARDILLALTVPSDEIRWCRDVPEGDAAAADWTGADQLRTAARQILPAGSLAVRGRAGYHGARHRGKARRALDAPSSGLRPTAAASPRSFPSTRDEPSPYSSTRRSTRPVKPSTTSAPPAGWRRSTPRSPPASAGN